MICVDDDPGPDAVDCIVCGSACEHDFCDADAERADLILDGWEAAAESYPRLDDVRGESVGRTWRAST